MEIEKNMFHWLRHLKTTQFTKVLRGIVDGMYCTIKDEDGSIIYECRTD